ncbi:MAG TPA: DUF885 domain-containing protein [Chthoniobacterales bacterium]|jgi:uncharacterized protein (DUF885 family)|nr:DUF885 domain-containing protein [Chthoniobacterales bacterium]
MQKAHLFFALILAGAATSLSQTPAPQASDESKRANEFLDKCFDEFVATHPQIESSLGIKTHNDQWNDISEEAGKRDLETAQKNLAELRRQFPKEKLDKQTQLSCDLYEFQVQRDTEGFKYRLNNYPVNQMFGVHSEIPTFLINIHKVDSQKDAQAYVARLNGIPKLFDQLLLNLKEREERGVIPPKFVFPLVLEACEKVIKGQPYEESGPVSPLLEDFTKKVAGLKDLDQPARDALIADARKALTESVKPAYTKLIAALREQEKKANDDAGVWKFRDGKEFYEFALRRTTTTNLTADQIHETGLKEVARIHGEMRKIMEQVKFKGDLQAFFKFMREDPQFYFPQTEEGQQKYLAMATKIIDTMKGRLDELFLTKPKADCVVKAVEQFRESSAGKAFYNQPAPDGSRPGMFYVNLSDMKSTPIYELESLAHHEGIPGHHMQIAIAQELKGIPKFRRFGGRYTAYSEGWGLYSELTPKEIGMYKDPYSDFGRLSLELWRAGRLVVDTGLHSEKKWTRQQAIDYLKQNTPNSEEDCVDSINRYIVMPSQATAYKIGMLRILELREKAKKQLGAKFDLRQFHDVVLTNGPVPLDMLEQLVDAWVKSKSAG